MSDSGLEARKKASSPFSGLPHTSDFHQVRYDEAALILKRRRFYIRSSRQDADGQTNGSTVRAVAPSRNGDVVIEPPRDLIGLALSGGGIRAASVGLGALQALRESDRLREVDYLSTVSGGGYIGGYLSVAALASSVDKALQAAKPCLNNRSAEKTLWAVVVGVTFNFRRKVSLSALGGCKQISGWPLF